MSFIRELYKAVGADVEIHNVITDYKLPDGRCAHQAHQIVANGEPCTDEDIIESVKAALPNGGQICSIYEFLTDCDLSELEKLAMSPQALKIKKRCIYLDEKLAVEYVREVLNGVY